MISKCTFNLLWSGTFIYISIYLSIHPSIYLSIYHVRAQYYRILSFCINHFSSLQLSISRSNQWLGLLSQPHLLHTNTYTHTYTHTQNCIGHYDCLLLFFFLPSALQKLTLIELLIGMVEEAIHVLMILQQNRRERARILNYCIIRRVYMSFRTAGVSEENNRDVAGCDFFQNVSCSFQAA